MSPPPGHILYNEFSKHNLFLSHTFSSYLPKVYAILLHMVYSQEPGFLMFPLVYSFFYIPQQQNDLESNVKGLCLNFCCYTLIEFVNTPHFHINGSQLAKMKRVFLTCPCHEIYKDEVVGLKSCKYTLKITIVVNIWNLGEFCENLIFCQ